MRTTLAILVVAILIPLLSACSSPGGCVLYPDPVEAVAVPLDTLHAAASRADVDAYFNCFAPNAVFLGTDASERWSLDQFRAYCKPYFDQGKGWTYAPHDRHVMFDNNSDPRIAWFDELLENEKYGTCRGSGVLVRPAAPSRSTDWKIVQYNLAFTIPNDKAAEVTAITKPHAHQP